MNYKPDESTLAAYLYGELSQDVHAQVTAYLADHPEAKKELEEIRSMQKMLGKFQDKEVVEPSFVFEDPSVVVISKNPFLSNFLKLTMGMAASIALLMLVGYFTQLRFGIENGSVLLSFGNEVTTPTTETISQEDIESWMAEAMDSNNNQLIEKINEVESSLSERVTLQQQTNKRQMSAMLSNYKVDQTVINQYVSQLKEDNKDIILSLVDVSERNQQQYMSAMIADFSAYLDQQRNNDLEVIQASFNNLKDNTEISQIETNEILASIISTVNGTENQF